jgi:hypothetical protein
MMTQMSAEIIRYSIAFIAGGVAVFAVGLFVHILTSEMRRADDWDDLR